MKALLLSTLLEIKGLINFSASRGLEFIDVSEVEEGDLAEVVYVGVKCEVSL